MKRLLTFALIVAGCSSAGTDLVKTPEPDSGLDAAHDSAWPTETGPGGSGGIVGQDCGQGGVAGAHGCRCFAARYG